MLVKSGIVKTSEDHKLLVTPILIIEKILKTQYFLILNSLRHGTKPLIVLTLFKMEIPYGLPSLKKQ